MRYYTIELDGTEKVAASVDGRELFVLEQFADMNELIALGGVSGIPEGAKKVGEDVKILSPIPRPKQDVLCLESELFAGTGCCDPIVQGSGGFSGLRV